MNNFSILFLSASMIIQPLFSMDKENDRRLISISQSKSTTSVIEQLKQSFNKFQPSKPSEGHFKECIKILKQDPQDQEEKKQIKDAASILLYSIIKNTNLNRSYVSDLLKLGADPNFKDTNKSPSTFVCAVKNNNIKAAQLMLNDTNANSEVLPRLPVLDYVACNPELNNFAEQLIQHGAHIQRNKSDNTPLYLALRCNNPKLARLLMEKGARINGEYELDGPTELTNTLLQYPELLTCFLTMHENHECFSNHVLGLISNAIKLDNSDAVKILSPYYACNHYSMDQMLLFLLPQAIQVNATKSVAFLISQLEDPRIIEQLLNRIENSSIATNLIQRYRELTNKSLPFAIVEKGIINNQVPFIQAIVDHDKQFDLIQKDTQENETLLITSLKNSSEMSLLLLKHIKACAHKNVLQYVNKNDFFAKNTALHYAVKQKNISAVKDLLALGADDTAINEFDATPAHFAQLIGNLELIKIFQDRAYQRRENYLSAD